MKDFPQSRPFMLYQILATILKSRAGIFFILILSFFLTSRLFISMNNLLEKHASWKETTWEYRARKGQENKRLCDALRIANRKLKNCNKTDTEVYEQTNLRFENKKTQYLLGLALEKLKIELKNRKEFPLVENQHFYVTIQNKPTNAIPDEPYIGTGALLEVSFGESSTERYIRTRLWVMVWDNQIRFSKTFSATIFQQEKLALWGWSMGLWPTQTLLEPKDLGRWLVHHFKQSVKEEFDAGYLLPDAKKLKRANVFLGSWMQNNFANSQKSFMDESFWLTFMNGTNHWGLIQWMSVFFAVFVLVQISIRFLLTEIESLVLVRYRKSHPIDFYQKEDPNVLYSLRAEYTNERAEFPRFQKFFLLRVMDNEFHSNEQFLFEKIEASRKIIDFLIASLSSIGFIGTITGIAFAINQAHQVVTPDEFARLQAIKSLSTDLALAFSTTFVALVLTLICDLFAKKQWKKEDLLLEEINVIHQAWLWQSKQQPFEQAQCTLPPSE